MPGAPPRKGVPPPLHGPDLKAVIVKVCAPGASSPGWEVELPRVSTNAASDTGSSAFTFTRKQFPITPATARTAHSLQGSTMSTMVLVTDRVFAPSQVYVALSRCTALKNLHIQIRTSARDTAKANPLPDTEQPAPQPASAAASASSSHAAVAATTATVACKKFDVPYLLASAVPSARVMLWRQFVETLARRYEALQHLPPGSG